MKQRFTGLIILVLVILGALTYTFWQKKQPVDPRPKKTVTLKGYLGGEKIGLYEDPEVQKAIKDKYNLVFDYQKAGSLDMIRADHGGKQYLFPSSQTAQELYNKIHGKPKNADLIFNTPIVLYSHKSVADAFVKQGLAVNTKGVYTLDMKKLTELLVKNTTWADVGLPQLYGPITIGTTDPTKSNSGNMVAGLLANMINGGSVVNAAALPKVLPELKNQFAKLGYMETSSADIFSQFLRTGIGNKPLIAGYENQILEFAATYPEDWKKLKTDLVILYPTPTVWSTHIYLALDDSGTLGLTALKDATVQELAWKKHGFRTGVAGVNQDTTIFGVEGVAEHVTSIMPMPGVDVMEQIIKSLGTP